MRRLVVCCDGTWNKMEQETGGVPTPTNVVRLYNALVEDAGQLRYYHPGVGTGRGVVDRLGGGGMGLGLSRNIKSAYAWLARNYQADDAIHLFGFSRGAYTARSLAGMLSACGLAPLNDMAGEKAGWAEVDRLYDEVYRPAHGRGSTDPPYPRVPITFIGVWDTVGALGIPDQFAIADLFGDRERHEFHDTRLSDRVVHARHAVAIDEARAPFTPTLWDHRHAPDDQTHTLRQVWFPGVHCDLGGGYPNCGLSDGALTWMISEAESCTDLRFRKELLDQINPDPGDVLHDSMSTFYRKVLGPRPRAIPMLDPTRRDPGVHESVYERQTTPPITAAPYRHHRTLTGPGDTATVDVFAGQPWNNSNLYLGPGTYEFTAGGEWLDAHLPTGPDGGGDGRLELGDLAWRIGDVAGWIQDWLHRRGKDHHEQLLLARRHTDQAWMALMGVIAARDLDDQGAQAPYEAFLIGSSSTQTVRSDRAGYLYTFANDAWAFYGNNRGSLRLTITRLS